MPIALKHQIAINALGLVLLASHGHSFAADSIMLRQPAIGFELKKTPTESTGNAQLDSVLDRHADKDYLTPALEIVGFNLLLNQINRRYSGSSDYDANFSTAYKNLGKSWNDDFDPFEVNQLGHPYQGTMYHGFARSAGLNFWESLGYAAAGSAFWEIAGEKLPPSRNDLITTSIGGSFLGEALFRMSNLLLEKAGGKPSFWHEIGAATIAPASGFNRHLISDKFDAIFASNNAAYYSRMQFGVNNTIKGTPNTDPEFKRNDVQLNFLIDYGQPGQPGYEYKRPFDYFVFEGTASSANVLENVMTRGLLLGTDYQVGENYQGLWGLYGSFDYISPQTFRVSSTALSLGSSGQLWLSESVALQGTVMAGLGYAAVSTINSVTEEDYHYGLAPQGLAALRLVIGKKLSIDMTGREYFVSDVDSNYSGGHDNIVRADTAITYRFNKQHALSIKYQWNKRDADFPDQSNKKQVTGTLGIYYTILGQDGLGVTDWR